MSPNQSAWFIHCTAIRWIGCGCYGWHWGATAINQFTIEIITGSWVRRLYLLDTFSYSLSINFLDKKNLMKRCTLIYLPFSQNVRIKSVPSDLASSFYYNIFVLSWPFSWTIYLSYGKEHGKSGPVTFPVITNQFYLLSNLNDTLTFWPVCGWSFESLLFHIFSSFSIFFVHFSN